MIYQYVDRASPIKSRTCKWKVSLSVLMPSAISLPVLPAVLFNANSADALPDVPFRHVTAKKGVKSR